MKSILSKIMQVDSNIQTNLSVNQSNPPPARKITLMKPPIPPQKIEKSAGQYTFVSLKSKKKEIAHTHNKFLLGVQSKLSLANKQNVKSLQFKDLNSDIVIESP